LTNSDKKHYSKSVHQQKGFFMNPPTVYSPEYFIFDYEAYDENSQVMAYNATTSVWETVDLIDVECNDDYEKFFFLDELPSPEPKTPVQKAKKKVDEMIGWISQWSVRAPAVDSQLQKYRDEIFQYLEEIDT
jgi:hypothetical protein